MLFIAAWVALLVMHLRTVWQLHSVKSELAGLRDAVAFHDETEAAEQSKMVRAEVRYSVDHKHETLVSNWCNRWADRLVNWELVDGCGCCTATMDFHGPKGALYEFPNTPTLKIVIKWQQD